MDVEKFLKVSTLRPNPKAEAELQKLRPFVEPRIEQAFQSITRAIDGILKRWPEAEPVVNKMRPVFWDAVSLSDVVYRRIVAVLNLTREERCLVRFENAARCILTQTPARDVPEQASFLSFVDRLYTLWRTLKDSEYYRPHEDDRFATDALLPLRPLHPGTNAMNANFVPGKRHYLTPDETRTIQMWHQGGHSRTSVLISPKNENATEVVCDGGTFLLDQTNPTMVVGRPLWLRELFGIQITDDGGRSVPLVFPVDAVIKDDIMYSRGAIRITRITVTEPEGSQVLITENGTFHDVDLGDRRYESSPDEQTGLHGLTRFFNELPRPPEPEVRESPSSSSL